MKGEFFKLRDLTVDNYNDLNGERKPVVCLCSRNKQSKISNFLQVAFPFVNGYTVTPKPVLSLGAPSGHLWGVSSTA